MPTTPVYGHHREEYLPHLKVMIIVIMTTIKYVFPISANETNQTICHAWYMAIGDYLISARSYGATDLGISEYILK